MPSTVAGGNTSPDAYPSGNIAPQDEVLVASLATGMLTIGVTAFALVTDISVAGTFAAIRRFIDDDITAFKDAVAGITQITIFTAEEAIAATVAAGAATGVSTPNIWSILVNFGTIIPKVIFAVVANAFWAKVGGAIAADEGAERVADTIPFVGQVMAIVAAVGDAATLAEVATETIIAPWVIENEISLSLSRPRSPSIAIRVRQRSRSPPGTGPCRPRSTAFLCQTATGSINRMGASSSIRSA